MYIPVLKTLQSLLNNKTVLSEVNMSLYMYIFSHQLNHHVLNPLCLLYGYTIYFVGGKRAQVPFYSHEGLL